MISNGVWLATHVFVMTLKGPALGTLPAPGNEVHIVGGDLGEGPCIVVYPPKFAGEYVCSTQHSRSKVLGILTIIVDD